MKTKDEADSSGSTGPGRLVTPLNYADRTSRNHVPFRRVGALSLGFAVAYVLVVTDAWLRFVPGNVLWLVLLLASGTAAVAFGVIVVGSNAAAPSAVAQARAGFGLVALGTAMLVYRMLLINF